LPKVAALHLAKSKPEVAIVERREVFHLIDLAPTAAKDVVDRKP
jgi:hypothetical protein